MRLLTDTLIALLLVATLGIVMTHYRQQEAELAQQQSVHEALKSMHEQMVFQGALGAVPVNEMGFPDKLEASWFSDGPPANALAPEGQPWIEVAEPGDPNDHPYDLVIKDDSQAAFWYNPERGIIRARVSAQMSDRAALEMYNRLNGTQLLALPQRPIEDNTPMLVHADLETDLAAPVEAPSRTARPTLANP